MNALSAPLRIAATILGLVVAAFGAWLFTADTPSDALTDGERTAIAQSEGYVDIFHTPIVVNRLYSREMSTRISGNVEAVQPLERPMLERAASVIEKDPGACLGFWTIPAHDGSMSFRVWEIYRESSGVSCQ